MTKLKAPYRGSCLCNSIQYEIDAIEPNMAHCHCVMCRKFHGADYATYGEAKKDNFRWLRGEENLNSYLGSNGTTRQFCNLCGSSLTFNPANNPDGIVEFSIGTLDCDIPHRPDAHVFVGSKANWSTINDELPQYSAGRDREKTE